MNICLVFSYNGSKFFGYQKQPNKRTVQEEIESCLSRLFNEEVKIYASGRTDAKVHAIRQYANFIIEEEKLKFELENLKYRLNKMLPNDIYILDVLEKDSEFNARFAAILKIYEYKFTYKKYHDVFKNGLITEINEVEQLDLNILNEAKNLFIGTHSFQNFTSKVEDKDNFVRTIFDIEFKENDDNSYSLIFKGSGFMMYQVRMMVANIVMAAIGKISLDEVKNLLNQKERNITNYCYPPEGLYLVDVKY